MNIKSKKITALLKSNKGFTLTEMLVVIALIGIVGTFVAQQVTGRFNQAKVDATKIQMRQLMTILKQFRIDCGRYPTTEENLDALVSKPQGLNCRRYDDEGYVEGGRIPQDGFENDFIYFSENGKTFEIKSLGNDRVEGGEDIDADISSNNLDGDES